MPSLLSRFLGTGPSFPFRSGSSGDGADVQIALSSAEEKIRESIWLILTTAKGERVMRADFGCGIHDLAFEAVSDSLIGRVGGEVRLALARWEPRIDVLRILVSPDAKEENLLTIDIEYQVRTTNSRFNLVYPFYVS